MSNKKFTVILILLLFGFIYRISDHAPNFTPLAAISLFGGYFFKSKKFVLLPISILFLSDLIIGFYNFGIMASTYLSFSLIVLIGIFISSKKVLRQLAIASSLAGSIIFFLVSNFSVWVFSNWYVHNLNGLGQCFLLALPFFRNTVLGDLFFTCLIFILYEIYIIYFANISHKNQKIKVYENTNI